MKIKRLIGREGMPIIDLMAVIFFSVYYILPAANNKLNMMLVLFLGIAYFGYIFIKDRATAIPFISIFVAVTLIALAFALLTDTKTISAAASYREIKHFFSKFSQYFFMYFPGLLVVRTLKTATKEQKSIFTLLIIGLFSIVIYNTLQELRINPYAMREWETFNELEDENIGNYYFVYAIPIVMLVISMCMTKLKMFSKIINAGMLVFLFYFLFEAKYTLAILIAFIGFVLQVLISLKTIYTKIIFTIAVTIVAFFVPDILLFISQNVDSMQVSIRFKELYSFFSSGDSSGYNLNGRLTLYLKSLEAFAHSPIIGNRNLDFDGHATCFTVLSDTGIIGGIPFYYLLFAMNKRTKLLLEENKKFFLPAFVCLLCMGFSNPIHSSLPLSFSVWFIVPLIIDTFINREGAYRK